jgi:hypothetical protein
VLVSNLMVQQARKKQHGELFGVWENEQCQDSGTGSECELNAGAAKCSGTNTLKNAVKFINGGTDGRIISTKCCTVCDVFRIQPIAITGAVQSFQKGNLYRRLQNFQINIQDERKSMPKFCQIIAGTKTKIYCQGTVWQRCVFPALKYVKMGLSLEFKQNHWSVLKTSCISYQYTGCFQKSFTTLKSYRNLYRGYTQRFELSKCSKTHRVLPRIVIRNCFELFFRFLLHGTSTVTPTPKSNGPYRSHNNDH